MRMSRKLAILLVIAAVAVFPHASQRATAAARSGVSAEQTYELDVAGNHRHSAVRPTPSH